MGLCRRTLRIAAGDRRQAQCLYGSSVSGQRSRVRRRPSLSQHFLRSRALAASLIAESNVQPGDLVIEIGAGLGTLTRELALRCGRLVAVEVDGRLLPGLRAEFGACAGVSLVHGDFLTFPLPAEAYKVFGNIPFSITADIVRRLVESPDPPDDIYCIVHREAAERFAGEPYAVAISAGSLQHATMAKRRTARHLLCWT